MPDYSLRLPIMVQRLDNKLNFVETLLFPENAVLHARQNDGEQRLCQHIAAVVPTLPTSELHRLQSVESYTTSQVQVRLEPVGRQQCAWRSAVTLHFPVVNWQHDDETFLALVGVLGIVVTAPSAEERQRRLDAEIKATLLRDQHAADLRSLVNVARYRELHLSMRSVRVELPSPKQAAIRERDQANKQKSVLSQVATNLANQTLYPIYELEDVIKRLAESCGGRKPMSVLLIGASGVGKTAAVHELVRQRAAWGMAEWGFYASSGSRLVAGMSGFGMWQERCQQLCRELSKRRVVLFLGNLLELMEVGKSSCSATGIAGFLRPYIGRGELLTIVECTPEQLPIIEREDPHLLDVFHPLHVSELSGEQAKKVLRQYSLDRQRFTFELGPHYPKVPAAPLTDAALEGLEQLHRRYATYSSYPGRPLRFLRNLLLDRYAPATALEWSGPPPDDPARFSALTRADVTQAFSRETGLPLFLLEDTIPLDLVAARQWFAARVLGQAEVVELVVELLATIKAGLHRPRKPIASLLFIGPTGVGKTEMAKALAEFLFGDPRRLTRFDMSEYGDPLAVQRLIGGILGAEGLLTAKVREQPFSVLLFDEVEKADARFFDLLLQILGEGRLTDAGGRLADFCNTVVVLTSNLGAEAYQQGGLGLLGGTMDRAQAQRHFVDAVRDAVRPELFNRIDRIVPFAPLDQTTVEQIAALQLEQIRRRDGLYYRDVALHLGPDVCAWLARVGFDARYGARPLKRAIERQLLAPLAEKMNRYGSDLALVARIDKVSRDRRLHPNEHREVPTAGDEVLRIEVHAQTDVRGRNPRAGVNSGEDAILANVLVSLRRDAQLLANSPVALELHNELFRLEAALESWLRMRKRALARGKTTSFEFPETGRLRELRLIRDHLQAVVQQAVEWEETCLLALYERQTVDREHLRQAGEQTRKLWHTSLLELYAFQQGASTKITMGLYSEDLFPLFYMARAYLSIARERGFNPKLWVYTLRPELPHYHYDIDPAKWWWLMRDSGGLGQPPRWMRASDVRGGGATLCRVQLEFPDEYLEEVRAGCLAMGLALQGNLAGPLFHSEGGWHVMEMTNHVLSCFVDIANQPIHEYIPPDGIDRRGALTGGDRRRLYNFNDEILLDSHTKQKINWRPDDVAMLLNDVLGERLTANALTAVRGTDAKSSS